MVVRLVIAALALAVPSWAVSGWLGDAEARLVAAEAGPKQEFAVASVSEDSYCTAELKGIVRRVASACGLVDSAGGRGCQPAEAKSLAKLSGPDFNAMFLPLAKRAHLIQFDADISDLDPGGQSIVEQAWSDQRGASFFFVVARASPEGKAEHHEKLSRARAEAVLKHLQITFDDPDLSKEVGLLWLGEEFAQLGDEFCGWSRSRQDDCTAKDINRSAFVAWIDCAI
jgi:outer membrane protein OmpA-like peptidoglycan-associated protein